MPSLHRNTPSLSLRLALGLAASALASSVVPAAVAAESPRSTPPQLGGCSVFPSNNRWNLDVSRYAVHPQSRRFIANINRDGPTRLHADFGGGGAYGIPITVVDRDTRRRWIHYRAYGDESDPGPFPIPSTARVEGGSGSAGDRHVIVLQRETCRIYELYRAFWRGNHWDADSGATWSLGSNHLRPPYWTSADAAGLPILPGLVRYEEVAAGEVRHAIRFTVRRTRQAFVRPARHCASDSDDWRRPPMGLRLRLRASYDLSRFHGQSLVILKALKKYGMIVADNGENWFLTGASDRRWDDEDLNQLKTVPGSAFEVVDSGRAVSCPW